MPESFTELRLLIGERFSEFDPHDGGWFGFESGSSLLVLNKSNAHDVANKMMGRLVKSVSYSAGVIVVASDEDAELAIDMTDDGWRGPESLLFFSTAVRRSMHGDYDDWVRDVKELGLVPNEITVTFTSAA
jgi:hypothetical protein